MFSLLADAAALFGLFFHLHHILRTFQWHALSLLGAIFLWDSGVGIPTPTRQRIIRKLLQPLMWPVFVATIYDAVREV